MERPGRCALGDKGGAQEPSGLGVTDILDVGPGDGSVQSLGALQLGVAGLEQPGPDLSGGVGSSQLEQLVIVQGGDQPACGGRTMAISRPLSSDLGRRRPVQGRAVLGGRRSRDRAGHTPSWPCLRATDCTFQPLHVCYARDSGPLGVLPLRAKKGCTHPCAV